MSPFRSLSRRLGLLAAAAAAALLAVSVVGAPAVALAQPPVGASVTVTILDQDNQPLSGAATQLTSQAPFAFAASTAGTDSSGSYTFEDVVPGSYDLSVQASDGTVYVASTPTPVVVTGTDPVAVTQHFIPPSSISGTLGGVDGGDMTGADVVAYTMDGDPVSTGDVTDSQGDYTVPDLSPGDYKLLFEGAPDSSYISQWWDNETESTLGDTVTIGASQAATGYNATLQLPAPPPQAATISGTVVGSNDPSVGLGGISIFAYDAAGDFPAEAETNPDGTYSIPLEPGKYTLDFQDRTGGNYVEQFYNNKATQDKATPITVGTTNVTNQNTVLLLGGSLSGRITDASTGDGIPDAGVFLNPLVGNIAEAADVDPDGSYVIHAIPPGSYTARYDVEDGSGLAIDYVVQYWNNHAKEADSDPVTFASGTTITDRDVALVPLFTTTTKPTVSGTAAVGQTLTASTPAWTPTADISYQWQRSSTSGHSVTFVDIPGATDPSYTVTNDDGGSTLAVVATGTRTGYSTTSTTSVPTSTVSGAVFTPGVPTINGDAVVGERLTVATGTWSPQPSFSYSWKRGATQVGTSSSYTPVAADIGQPLTVTVTASKPPLVPVSVTSAPTDAVVAATLTATPVPTVTGTAAVGQTIKTTVSSSAWQPRTVTLAYQWNRDGVAIDGATNNSYTLTNDDAGATMTVTVTGSKSGYTTVAETSLPTGTVTGGTFTSTPTPTITGTATVGETLTSDAGTWLPSPDALAYQWNRDGTAIDGATDASYQLTATDAGTAITLSVTGSREGFTGATATSLPTDAVAKAAFTTTPTPTVTGDPIVGATVTADAGTWAPGTVTLAYQWNRDGAPIDGATSPSYLLTGDDARASISVMVTGSEPGFSDASTTSAGTDPILSGPISAGTATVAGVAQVGEVLTASATGFTPTPDAVSYAWQADGQTIANGATFTVTAAELGKKMTVEATATLDNYLPVTATSDPTDAVVAAPEASISAGAAVQGSTVTITGEGFLSSPSYEVDLHSAPVVLGTVTPDENGDFTTQVTIPKDTAPGAHHIVIVGSDGTEFASLAISITAQAPTAPSTPTNPTGSSSTSPIAVPSTAQAQAASQGLASTGTTISLAAGAVALVALLVGLALVLIRRRRQLR